MPQKNKPTVVRVEHIWSVLCSNSSVDQASNNISLFSVLEQLNLDGKQIEEQKKSEKKIVVPINFQLVSFLRKIGDGQFAGNLKTEIVSPHGETLGTGENEVKFDSDKDRLRAIFRFPGMPVAGPGYYEFKVSLRSAVGQYEKIAEVPLQVVFN